MTSFNIFFELFFDLNDGIPCKKFDTKDLGIGD